MKAVLSDFIAFLRGNPIAGQKTNLTPWNKSIFTVRVLLILLASKLVIGLMTTLLVKADIIDYIPKNESLQNWLAHTSTLDFLVEILLCGPLLEELAFRGILQKNLQLVWIGFSCLFYIVISNGFRIDYYSIRPTTLALMGLSVLISVLLRSTIGRFIQWTGSGYRFRWLIWSSVIGFALLHYSNYSLSKAGPLTVLVVLLPHLVAGLLFSWTSLQIGLRWSVYLHVLNNTIPALIVLKESSLP